MIEKRQYENLSIRVATITASQNLTFDANRNIELAGTRLKSEKDLSISAGQDLTIDSVATKEKLTYTNKFFQEKTTSLTSNLEAGGSINLASQKDMTLNGAAAKAGQNMNLKVEGNLTITSVKDSIIKDATNKGRHKKKRVKTNNETVIASDLTANGNMNINTAGTFELAGSYVGSETGAVTVNAGKGVDIQEVNELHEILVESKKKKSGLLSKKTKVKKDHVLVNEVIGSTVSGNTVSIKSDTDLAVKGGNIIATNDLSLTAANNVSVTSAAETGVEDHYKKTKKSGLFGGGGFGFTIGSKSEKATENVKTLGEVGSTIGSLSGNVAINAGNQVASRGTTIVSGKDLVIIGKGVSLDNTVDTYDSRRTYKVKQSGLSVSLGGGSVVNKAVSAAGNIERATEVNDERLKSLYAYKAVKDMKELNNLAKDGLTGKSITEDISVNISIGSSKQSSVQTVHTENVNPSNINAGGSTKITATAEDVDLSGVKMNSDDIIISAAKDINIDAAQNIQQIDSKKKSSSWAVGGTIGTGFFGSGSRGSSKKHEKSVTNVSSVVDANGTATLISGEDTNVFGSRIKGEKVVVQTGGNLNLVSLQDTNDYTERSRSAGIDTRIGTNGGAAGSISKGKINSNYASVKEQTGIYAGTGGFDIHVSKNTDLQGAVISSEATPDKNKISTNTMTYSDIENRADYSASSVGVGYAAGKDANGKDVEKKDLGLTPNIGVTASGDADSTTKSAISPGSIEVRSNPNQDLSELSRDPAGAVNALGKIFDKKTVQEKQELAQVFGEEAYKKIGDLAIQNGWVQGGPETTALHALVGGIMADLGGGSFTSGAMGAGVSEAVQSELSKITDPALRQWASAVVGAAASSTVGDAQTGASTAASGTKNNDENVHEVTINGTTYLAAGLGVILINGQKTLVDDTGKAIAWLSDTGTWIANEASSAWDDFVLWAKQTGKEKANDVPSWAKGNSPNPGESGKDFAKRLMDEKYGPGNYDTGPGSEYNKLKKWGDRGFKR